MPGCLDSQLPSGETEAQTGSQPSSGETEARRTATFIEDPRPNFEFGKEGEGRQVPSLPALLLPHPGPASVSLPSQTVRPLMAGPSQPPSGPRASGSARISLIRLCAGPPAHNQPQGEHALLCCVPCWESPSF